MAKLIRVSPLARSYIQREAAQPGEDAEALADAAGILMQGDLY